MRFTAKIERDEHETGHDTFRLGDLVGLMRQEDGLRLYGDLFRHSANFGWTINVSACALGNREVVKRFLYAAEMGEQVRYEFGVVLEGEGGHEMIGSLLVYMKGVPHSTPHYTGYSIHT